MFSKFLRFLIFIWCSIGSVSKSDQTVIANSLVIDKTLSRYNLVEIFTRKKTFWSDGRKIIVYTMPFDSIEHRLFTINVLNLSPYRYKTAVDSIVFSGLSTPTIELATESEMIYKLSTTPYSIGYISTDMFSNNNHEIIKINYE